MAITKAKINRTAKGKLVIYTNNPNCTTLCLYCSRVQIKEYLKSHDWHSFDWNGERFAMGRGWESLILN